jgi:hypothetical protein
VIVRDAPANDAVEHPGPAATDVLQTQTKVVEHVRAIVAITGLRHPTAAWHTSTANATT